MSETIVIDHALGNPGSILNMHSRLGLPARLSREPADILAADRLILPGVGHFDEGMGNLNRHGIVESLNEAVLEKKTPIVGVCLGLQLMTLDSEEGNAAGLGWFQGHTRHFRTGNEAEAEGLKFPHIGWNYIESVGDHPLLADLPDDPRFYFVHTYRAVMEEPSDIAATSDYGDISFTAMIARANIAAIQAHPEKSHKFGMQFYRNFSKWTPTDE